MARHGESKHLKRAQVSGNLVIPRKKNKYFVRQYPGRHKNRDSVAILSLLRDVMKITENAKESRFLIRNGFVKVDGAVVKEEKFGVGFGDLVDIKGDKFLVSVTDKGKICVIEDPRDGNLKLVKIVSKMMGPKGKTVFFTNDSRNIASDNEKLQIGDSILFNVSSKQIEKVIPLDQGAEIMVFTGKNSGKKGKVIEISGKNVVIENKGSKLVLAQDSCIAV